MRVPTTHAHVQTHTLPPPPPLHTHTHTHTPLHVVRYSNTNVARMSVLSDLDAKHQLISVVCTSAVRCCRGMGQTPSTTPSVGRTPDFASTFVPGGSAAATTTTTHAEAGAAAGTGAGAAAAAGAGASNADGAAAPAGSPLGSPAVSVGSGGSGGISAFSHGDVLTEHLSLLKYLLRQLEGRLDKAQCFLLWDLIDRPQLPSDQSAVFAWFQVCLIRSFFLARLSPPTPNTHTHTRGRARANTHTRTHTIHPPIHTLSARALDRT
jgi:hypothetical protein